MIIKNFRLPVAYGADRLCNHVLRGAENEQIIAIQGTAEDLFDMVADARALGQSHAIWHVVIAPAPNETTTVPQLLNVYRGYVSEFGLDPTRAVIRAHQKARITSRSGVPCLHLHAMLPAFRCDEAGGRVISNSHDRRRQEVLARIAEFDLGHPLLRGRHHAWVLAELPRRGRTEVAAALRALHPEEGPRPRASLSPATIQALQRRGLSATRLRADIRCAWSESSTAVEFHERLAAIGALAAAGTGSPPTWVITVEGEFLGTLAGMLRNVTRETINAKLGDPDNVRSDQSQQANHKQLELFADGAERSDSPRIESLEQLERLGPQPAADDDGRAGSADAARDQSEARPATLPAGDGERRSHPDRRGVAPADPPADAGSGARAAAAAGTADLVHTEPGNARASIVGGVEPRQGLRLYHHHLIELAQLASRAAESARDRVDRCLDEFEGASIAAVLNAKIAPAETDDLIAARGSLAHAAQLTAQARQRVVEADRRLAAAMTAHAAAWPIGRGRFRAALEDSRKEASAAAENLRFWEGREAAWSQKVTVIVDEAAKLHRRRVATADARYQAQHEIFLAARRILFSNPRIAALGLPTLLHAAYVEVALPDDPEARNIWGIPYPGRRRVVVEGGFAPPPI